MTTNPSHHYDIIVIGGGHAGIEAAHAAAKLGMHTALITLEPNKIGWMPCNPAIGGVGKGHIVFEISALGGLMPTLCSKTYLQVRMLNTKKGPAVQGLRLQIDKPAYQKHAQQTLEQTKNLTIVKGEVEEILTDDYVVRGVKLADGQIFSTKAAVVTTGTFLQGITHIGAEQREEGRQNEPSAKKLSASLTSIGLELGRLKTGTPPRLDRTSLDFSKMETQDDMTLDYLFEFHPHATTSSHACYITHTNTRTHEIIRNNLERSPIFSGQILSRGPRYCPSIEDKVFRFSSKESHQIFVEPESADNNEIYPNGLSTGLPLEVQEQYIQSIAGFENARIVRPGYAVEYDFVWPNQLRHTLETKKVSGLFCAGQINGTTGYEEAAGQGLIAGINAVHKITGKKPFTLERHESYIGVMIDDLVTMSVDEPYRMFTSRAERRLLLRQDNAFLRLTDKGYACGMIEENLYQDFCAERDLLTTTLADLRSRFNPSKLVQLIATPHCPHNMIKELANRDLPSRVITNIHAEILYEPYLKRELREIERTKQYQALAIPASIDFSSIEGLSTELQQKLNKYQPATIANAMMIPGMTPAAISLLIFHVRMGER